MLLIIVISCSHIAYSQHIKPSKSSSHLHIIRTIEAYEASIKANADNTLLLIKNVDNQIIIDLKYGTSQNFTKSILYKNPNAFARKPVAYALKDINKALEKLGYCLKIYDAYRPYSVTVTMWKVVKDHRFVANPAKGSGHNRGASVDVTIVNKQTGEELEMGTPYDDFTEKASHKYTSFSKEVLANRKLLKNIMQQYGFESLQTEWWHYIFQQHKKFDLMDIDLEELIK